MKKCFKDKDLVNDKLYDINQIFKTEEEIKDLNAMFYSFIILQDIIDFPEKTVPLNPYLLGALLGDGNMSDKDLVFTVAEDDLKEMKR